MTRRPGARGWVGWLALGLSLAAAAAVIVVGLMVQDQDKESEADRANIAALSEALRQEQAARIDDGQLPVTPPVEEIVSETPDLVQGEDGKDGAKGDKGDVGPGPSPEQVRAAVVNYLTANPPAPGRPPTEQEIAGAVGAYCATRGGCRGDTGAQGAAGVGQTGPTGAQGPGPSAEQVAAEVAAYCSAGACVGPMGPAGQTGAPGQDAPRPPRGRFPAPLGREWECDVIWTAELIDTANCVIV